jgi:hypothetical protein
MAEQYSPMVITASVLRSSQQAGEPFQLVTDEIKDNQVQKNIQLTGSANYLYVHSSSQWKFWTLVNNEEPYTF